MLNTLMPSARPLLVGTLGAWFLMALAATLAWKRGEQSEVAWLIWPSSVIGAVVADRFMRLIERYRALRQEADEARAALHEALQRQEVLTRALTDVRAAAHRAAQPLTAVMGYTDLLQKRCAGLSPACDQQLDGLREAVDRLAEDLEALRQTARSALE